MLKLNRDQTELLIRFNTRFRFDPLSRAFSNRCVLDEQVQHISVDGRPKLIEMYALRQKAITSLALMYSSAS